MNTWHDVYHLLNEQKGQKGKKDPIFLVLSESERSDEYLKYSFYLYALVSFSSVFMLNNALML